MIFLGIVKDSQKQKKLDHTRATSMWFNITKLSLWGITDKNINILNVAHEILEGIF